MRTDELDYHLPEALIATQPATPRDAARLMVVHRHSSCIEHRIVRDLAATPPWPGSPAQGDLLVLNRTRVLPAYLQGIRTKTGGHVTGLFIRSDETTHALTRWQVMLQAKGTLTTGETIDLHRATPHAADDTTCSVTSAQSLPPASPQARLTLIESTGPGQWLANLQSDLATADLLHHIGAPPLPPYIRKARKTLGLDPHMHTDAQRYNTIFADQAGSVAAPTAGLHLTDELLDAMQQRGIEIAKVTLHVGIGTFMPIRCDHLDDHDMHEEWIDVPRQAIDAIDACRKRGRRIFAVGTTVVRTLESLPDDPADELPRGYRGMTSLMIKPGHRFRHVDALMTNFHLPRSTLLALVAALPGAGIDQVKQWYAEAVTQRYRFYSYGDAMLLV